MMTPSEVIFKSRQAIAKARVGMLCGSYAIFKTDPKNKKNQKASWLLVASGKDQAKANQKLKAMMNDFKSAHDKDHKVVAPVLTGAVQNGTLSPIRIGNIGEGKNPAALFEKVRKQKGWGSLCRRLKLDANASKSDDPFASEMPEELAPETAEPTVYDFLEDVQLLFIADLDPNENKELLERGAAIVSKLMDMPRFDLDFLSGDDAHFGMTEVKPGLLPDDIKEFSARMSALSEDLGEQIEHLYTLIGQEDNLKTFPLKITDLTIVQNKIQAILEEVWVIGASPLLNVSGNEYLIDAINELEASVKANKAVTQVKLQDTRERYRAEQIVNDAEHDDIIVGDDEGVQPTPGGDDNPDDSDDEDDMEEGHMLETGALKEAIERESSNRYGIIFETDRARKAINEALKLDQIDVNDGSAFDLQSTLLNAITAMEALQPSLQTLVQKYLSDEQEHLHRESLNALIVSISSDISAIGDVYSQLLDRIQDETAGKDLSHINDEDDAEEEKAFEAQARREMVVIRSRLGAGLRYQEILVRSLPQHQWKTTQDRIVTLFKRLHEDTQTLSDLISTASSKAFTILSEFNDLMTVMKSRKAEISAAHVCLDKMLKESANPQPEGISDQDNEPPQQTNDGSNDDDAASEEEDAQIHARGGPELDDVIHGDDEETPV